MTQLETAVKQRLLNLKESYGDLIEILLMPREREFVQPEIKRFGIQRSGNLCRLVLYKPDTEEELESWNTGITLASEMCEKILVEHNYNCKHPDFFTAMTHILNKL